MDGICSAILNKIYALGSPGRYFVVSSEEFFESFPEDGKRDESELKRALKTLSAEGYIDIKYSSGSMYCVTLLKEYVEQAPPEEEVVDDGFEEYYPPEVQINYSRIFFAAFGGGAIGSAVMILIFFLFGLV